ncbi:hypothetical protein C0Q70_09584 [Pomacea canaliculata]|uniref:Uncharacterized protein n=1 Tax=Pomacea canaliculata TaxID=400727 RepID=A0A2T7PA74_POMCA|nr:hypothetical protein C0Q70_09584 [Pomacea canaliculata]
MEIPSSGVYLLIAGICFAVTVQVALASGRLRVTLIRYEFLYYGRQPTRTSTLAATQPTVAAPSSTESVSPPPSDVTTDTPRDAGDVRGPLHRETDSEEPSTTQELSFPWQQETVCNTTSPPRPRYRFLLCVDYSDP